MQIRILALALMSACPALAQELAMPPAAYPLLADFALDAGAFAPPGWTIEAQATGDLDGDGDADVVFVLHERNPANIVANEGLGTAQLDTNPRILGVGFRDGDGYTLALQNHTVIPRHTAPVLDDPFDGEGGLTVARGAFSVTLRSFSSAGSWEMGDATLAFRWQNGRFELIGWERTVVKRNTGEETVHSANFSTRVLEVREGSIEHDRQQVTRRTLKKGARAIDEVGDGLLFGTGAPGHPQIE